MAINERGEFVRERPVTSSDANRPLVRPRRTSPWQNPALGVVVVVLLALVVFLVWRSVPTRPNSASLVDHSFNSVNPVQPKQRPLLTAESLSNSRAGFLGNWYGAFNCHVRQHSIEMNVYETPSGVFARVFVANIGAALYRVTWDAEGKGFQATPEHEVQHIVNTTWLNIEGRYDSSEIRGVVMGCGPGNLQMDRTRSTARLTVAPLPAGSWTGMLNCEAANHLFQMTFVDLQSGPQASVSVSSVGDALYKIEWYPERHSFHGKPDFKVDTASPAWQELAGTYDANSIEVKMGDCEPLVLAKNGR